MPSLTVVVQDNQWYPVDDITQHTSCKLYRPFGNLTIKVYIYIIYATISIDPRLGSFLYFSYMYRWRMEVLYQSC